MLAYLVVSGTFCFPGITSSTVSPGLVSKNPGRAPKDALFMSRVCVVHRTSHAGLSRGFCWLSRIQPRFSFSDTLSKRHGSLRSTPHGFAYCKSPSGRRFSSPAGQYSSLILHSSVSGIARPFPFRPVSAEPRALAATCPLGHLPVFPHPDERHVYFVDSFIRCS